MKGFGFVLLFIFFLGILAMDAQISTDCSNAVPICTNTPVNGGTTGFGVDDFNGAAVSGCLEQTISGVIESNSAWYRFKTGASGQLGFNIGLDPTEDWDFALYKTNDCNNLGDPIRCNFFDNQDGNVFIGVGEDPTGDVVNVQYAEWLNVAPGEEYYLLINNYSNSNSGFSIQFSGSIFETDPFVAMDCSIVNNLLGSPISACENDNVILDATTASVITYNWYRDSGSGFQPISGEHNATYQVQGSAMYRVEVVTLSGNNIISDVQVVFSPQPQSHPVSDVSFCSDMTTYDFSAKDAEVLGSQDSTDFIVSYYESQADAMSGANFLPKTYNLIPGTTTIYTRIASINNSKCFDASQQFQLTVLETPMLSFPLEAYLCENNGGISIGETLPDSRYTYLWDSGEISSSLTATGAGQHTLTVTHTQGGFACSNSATVNVVVSEPPKITDVLIEDLRNNNTVVLVLEKDGDFEYRLDDESYQTGKKWENVSPGAHTITVNDPKGCGEVSEEIVVVGFPKFFTPNGDSANLRWNIEGLSYLQNPVVYIYDRYGKLLKQLTDRSEGWDGRSNGAELPASDYWFKLTYEDNNGQRTVAKYINNHFSLKR